MKNGLITGYVCQATPRNLSIPLHTYTSSKFDSFRKQLKLHLSEQIICPNSLCSETSSQNGGFWNSSEQFAGEWNVGDCLWMDRTTTMQRNARFSTDNVTRGGAVCQTLMRANWRHFPPVWFLIYFASVAIGPHQKIFSLVEKDAGFYEGSLN